MGLEFGIAMFITADGVLGPVEVARAVEERGFDSLLACEHGHIPVGHVSRYPNGGELPRFYARAFDPFVALTAAAGVTSRILLGTGIALLAQRDAILTAKEVASVDRLSGGRFVFGIGGGWNREEIADHGVDPARRFEVMRDKLLAMREIWSHEVASYEGEFVRFGPMWSAPKPVQVPYPPVWVGGAGPSAMRLVAEVGDEWLPSVAREEGLVDKVRQVQELAAQCGRGPVPVTGLIPRTVAAGASEALVERCAEAGCERVILAVPPEPESDVLETFDQFAHIAASYR